LSSDHYAIQHERKKASYEMSLEPIFGKKGQTRNDAEKDPSARDAGRKRRSMAVIKQEKGEKKREPKARLIFR